MHKSRKKKRRTEQELALIKMLNQWLTPNTLVTLLEHRVFGHHELYELLATVEGDYVIRFWQTIWVHWQGECRKANDWIAKSGRARMPRKARVTADGTPVPVVVTAKAARMKAPRRLATSLTPRGASETVEPVACRGAIGCW